MRAGRRFHIQSTHRGSTAALPRAGSSPKGAMMNPSRTDGRLRPARHLLTAAALAAGLIAGTTASASAATTATFSAGTLSVFGDSADNAIAISRDAAGK